MAHPYHVQRYLTPPFCCTTSAGPVERKVRATMSAQTEQAATAIASGVNDFAATLPGGGFPYTPAADFFSRKLLLTSDEVKTMIENVLRKAVANSAATKAKLADFVRDGLSFNMDLLLEYPETTSAQEMDEDAAKTDQITRAVSESIAELPASLKDSFNAEVTATVVEEAKYVAAARTSDMRDIIATINTAAAQTTNFGNAIDTYLGGGRGVASLFAGVVQNAIYSGLDNTTVPGFGIVEGNRTESTQYRIKLRLTYSDVSSEVMDETSRKVYSIVDDAMKADTRRKLLAPDVFEAACGGTVTSSCIFDGATYLGLEAEGFSGAAAVRAWLSGVVLAIVAIMLIA